MDTASITVRPAARGQILKKKKKKNNTASTESQKEKDSRTDMEQVIYLN